MKPLSLISTSTLCVAMMACSTAANPVAGAAGSSPGTAGSAGTAGSPGTAGSAPVGGDSSVAGNTVGGDSSVGGDVTVGGNSSVGGSGGTDATAGTGGTPAAGGTSGGSGGAPPSGGAGNAGGGGSIEPTMFSGGWDGALLEYPCSSKGTSVDCPNDTTCKYQLGTSNLSSIIPAKLNGQNTPTTWTVGGTVGTTYDVHVLIRGVVEAYNYVGGTIDKTSGTPNNRQDLFGEDGTPQLNSNSGSGNDYNTYTLTVTPPTGTAKLYHLNAVPNSENPHTSQLTQHRSFPITEDKHIMIPGGSKVSLAVGDSNCVEIMNCGDQAGGSCTTPWTIPLAGSTPPIPATGTFTQPFSANGSYGQWVSFDVLGVVAK
jgi:hypothetical protein